MWAEDYDLDPSQSSMPPYFDLLLEYWPEDWDEEDEEEADEDESADDKPEGEISWRVQIEYVDETTQEITACGVYLMDRPKELYLAMLEYFEAETDNLYEEYTENFSLE